MTKEQQYAEQLKRLGVYDEAFEPAIHALCIQERELSRTMKAWKATAPDPKEAPSPLSPLYAVIQTQRRDINTLRDALGLTPKGLQKLRGKQAPPTDTVPQQGASAPMTRLLEMIASDCGVVLPGGAPNG